MSNPVCLNLKVAHNCVIIDRNNCKGEKVNFLYIGLYYIPSHREEGKSFNKLVAIIRKEEKLSEKESETILKTVLPFLHMFNMLREGDNIKIAGQMQNYLRNSFLWYLKNKQTILENWQRRGTSKELIISNLLNHAPYFLKILEQRKVNLSKQNTSLELEATRIQPVSLILIKTMIGNESHLLHQWDQKSEAYQMIGGKIRLDENPIDAAKRELLEELSNTDLIDDVNFNIQKYLDDSIVKYEISNTYGALTKYEICIFHVVFKDAELELSKLDKWVSVAEIVNKRTNENEKIINTGKLLEDMNKGFFNHLPVSVNSIDTDYMSYLEVKPSLFGVKFDLKKYFKDKRIM